MNTKKLVKQLSKIKLSWKMWVALWIIALALPISLKIFLKPNEAEAGWWNPAWQYRKLIPITYSGSENLTEYQVLVELDTATMVTDGKLQSDCDDLRFVSQSGSILDYSVVGATCNTTDTQIWVKTDRIPGGDINIMMYYGNSSAPRFQDEVKTFSYTAEKNVGYNLYSLVDQLEIISLEQNNSITHNGTTLNLGMYETGQFTSIDPWAPVSAKKLFNADDESGDMDMLVPISWAGTEFTFYERYSNLKLHALAPWQEATLTVYEDGVAVTGCTSQTISSSGAFLTCSTGTGNIRIESNHPVLIFQEMGSGDEFPLKPNTTEKLIGSGGGGPYLTSNENGATYYYANESSSSLSGPSSLAADSTFSSLGGSSFGLYAVMAYSTDNPIGLHAQADSDGGDSYVYASITEMGTRWGSAVNNTDYITFGSDQPATCTMYDNTGTQLGQTTLSSSNTLIYGGGFGIGDSNTYTTDPWYVTCDAQVAAHFQKAGDTESGLWTYPMMRQFTYPTPAVGTLASEEISTAGPIAYWKFDEGSGTTANDSAGSNDGTITGATWVSEDQCVSGKCLQFNGSSNYTSVSHSSDISFNQTKSFTISGWFKTGKTYPDGNNEGSIVNKRDTNDRYRIFIDDSDQKLVFDMGDGTSVATTRSSAVVNDNRWHHFVATYTAGTSIELYVDGNSGGVINTSISDFSNSANLYIGSEFGTSDYFHGYIDEVKIYPFAISADQVKQDFNKGSAVSLGAIDQGPLSDGLVGYWKMDEASWNGTSGEVLDASSNGRNGTSANSANVSVGKFGNAGSFDGSNKYVTLPNTALGTSKGKTGCAWINPTAHTNQLAAIFRKGNDMSIRINSSGKYSDRVWNSAGATSSEYLGNSIIPTGTWSHICVVWESPGPNQNITLKVYLNGAIDLDQTTDLSDSNGLVGSDLTRSTRIGSDPDISSRIFDGKIDEVRIYNRALSAREVTDLYHYAPGPVGYWKMDEGSGTTANDSSGNGNNGTLGNSTTWTKGKYGGATVFDGVDDYINLGNATQLKTQSLTISTWVYYNSDLQTDSNGTLFSAVDGTGYELVVSKTSRRLWWAKTDQWTINNTDYYLPDKTWVHVAMTYDSNSGTKVYANGQLVDSDPTTATISYGSSDVRIGNRADTNTFDFGGSLDEIKFYNYARTSQQIVQDMNAGHPTGGSPVGSQVAYWKFDEQYGQTANDSVGGNDGTLGATSGSSTDDPTWQADSSGNCKINGCLSFDGGDYVEIDDNTSLNPTDLTVSLWLKRGTTQGTTQWPLAKRLNDGDYYDYAILFEADNTLKGYIENNGNTNSSSVQTTTAITDQNWHHLAMTFDDNANTHTLFIDGKMVAQNTDVAFSLANTSNPLIIGALTTTPDQGFSGSIDEVKIYNSALTAEQIKLDMNAGSGVVYGVASNEADDLSDGAGNPPILYWPFDEKTGTTTTYDKSGNNYNGTLTNAPSWTRGKIGAGLDFNGSTQDVRRSVFYTGTTNLTMSAWFYVRSANNSIQEYLMYNGSGGSNGYGLILSDGSCGNTGTEVNLLLGGNSCDALNSTYNLPLGEWVYLSLTRDSTTWKLYANGQLKHTGTTNPATPTNNFLITASGQAIDGVVDDVKFYDYARTPAQIMYDYNRGAPVAWYKMDECQGTTIHDASGNGNDGTLTIGATGTQTSAGTCSTSGAWANGATGKYSSSMNFDGTDDYIEATSSLDSIPFTIAGWIKYTANLTTPGFASYTDSNGRRRDVYVNNNNSIRIFTYNGTNAYYYVSPTFTPINDGEWHHIAGTFDGTTPLVYVDGIQYAVTQAGSGTTYPTSRIKIGALNISSMLQAYYFDGQIDDVRIYNYSLSADQVKKVMNEGSGVRFGD